MKNSHRHLILIPLAASALLFLGACGNKGPLVMPQQPVPVEEVVEPADAPAAGDGQQDQQDQGATPPAMQDVDDGNPASVPDPVSPEIDDSVDDGNE